MAVGFIERMLQAAAGFTVDPAYGIFQCSDRFVQVLRLVIQMLLAFAFAVQLLYRRQIDGTQRFDFPIKRSNSLLQFGYFG